MSSDSAIRNPAVSNPEAKFLDDLDPQGTLVRMNGWASGSRSEIDALEEPPEDCEAVSPSVSPWDHVQGLAVFEDRLIITTNYEDWFDNALFYAASRSKERLLWEKSAVDWKYKHPGGAQAIGTEYALVAMSDEGSNEGAVRVMKKDGTFLDTLIERPNTNTAAVGVMRYFGSGDEYDYLVAVTGAGLDLYKTKQPYWYPDSDPKRVASGLSTKDLNNVSLVRRQRDDAPYLVNFWSKESGATFADRLTLYRVYPERGELDERGTKDLVTDSPAWGKLGCHCRWGASVDYWGDDLFWLTGRRLAAADLNTNYFTTR